MSSTRAYPKPDKSDKHHYEEFRRHNKDRTDVSFFLCHFTKSKEPVNQKHSKASIRGDAHERFKAILTDREVIDSALPHLGGDDVRAVCFTEMMLPSLSVHAEIYSPWGFAFHKSFLFNNSKANPVLYCRHELFQSLKEGANGNHELLRYMTPLNPKYWDQPGPEVQQVIDYSHEREWRTPGPVSFKLENLAYVFVPDIHVFKELMPDLHTELCNESVEIRVIEKVVGQQICRDSYGCGHGSRCVFGHALDEKDVFRFREKWAGMRPARAMSESWRRSPKEPDDNWR